MMDFIVENAGAIGLVFFFTTFITIFFKIFIFGSKEKFESYARIPLDGNEENN